MRENIFLDRLKNGEILISDGATGSNLLQRGLPRGVSSEAWVLDNPEEIIRLHQDFIMAGRCNGPIRIIYTVSDDTVSLNKVDFYGTMNGLESDFGYMYSVPNGITEKSLEEIAACLESTPGFEMVLFIGSLLVVIVLLERKQ